MSRSFCELKPTESVEVGDIEIAYKSFGSGDPLVMITGDIATMELWDPLFVQTLASERRACKGQTYWAGPWAGISRSAWR